MSKKHFLARKTTRIYLESYFMVMFLVYLFPIVYMLIVSKNAVFFGANILFFELNLFFSLVLLIYTYFTRDENDNWNMFLWYFVLTLIFLVSSMLILGGNLYI